MVRENSQYKHTTLEHSKCVPEKKKYSKINKELIGTGDESRSLVSSILITQKIECSIIYVNSRPKKKKNQAKHTLEILNYMLHVEGDEL